VDTLVDPDDLQPLTEKQTYGKPFLKPGRSWGSESLRGKLEKRKTLTGSSF
jgi:hypothetical protein